MAVNFYQDKTVQTWLEGVHEQSGASPDVDAQRVAVLAEFCTFVDREPGQIIDECIRDVEGGKKIRVKGRRFYAQKIQEFEQQSEGSSAQKRQRANYIRSFLIHNGVLLQTSPLL
jgi:hypothetical protein